MLNLSFTQFFASYILFRETAFDVDQGSCEEEASLPDLAARVREAEPLHSMGVRLIGGELRPLVSHLVSSGALVACTPPDLDFDVGVLGAEFGDVLSGDDRPWVAGGHPPDGCLRVRKDGGCSECMVSGCRFP